MIESSLRIHDKFQFEIKINYLVTKDKKESRFRFNSYFFIPQSVGINSHTYSKTQFYQDRQYHIRLKTPVVALRDLAIKNGPYIVQLNETFLGLSVDPSEENKKLYEYELKMFCCVLKSSLRDQVYFIRSAANNPEFDKLVKNYCDDVEDVAKNFRNLQGLLNVPSIPKKERLVYKYADEYLSLIIEQYSFLLLDLIKDKDKDKKNQKDLLKLIKQEKDYRDQRKFLGVVKDKSENEEYVFRRSVLKKFIESVLYLKKETDKETTMVEQVSLGAAAGVAMVFATMLALFINFGQREITVPTFILLVLSYIFKDRIKDWLKLYFARRIDLKYYDYKTDILDSKENVIAHLKDKMNFINEDQLPEKITDIRNKNELSEIDNDWLGEVIIRYQNELKIENEELKSSYRSYDTAGISEILRYSINNLIVRTDNPEKEVYFLEKDSYSKIKTDRVYHLHLVIHSEAHEETHIKHFLIVFNRKGIKRVEVLNNQ
jgi:hypothetical protein